MNDFLPSEAESAEAVRKAEAARQRHRALSSSLGTLYGALVNAFWNGYDGTAEDKRIASVIDRTREDDEGHFILLPDASNPQNGDAAPQIMDDDMVDHLIQIGRQVLDRNAPTSEPATN